MKKNIGITDRTAGSIIALTFVILFIKEIIPGPVGNVLIVVAGMFFLSRLVSLKIIRSHKEGH